jgi:lipopolysaccharide export LptBFGC system permease protein LptF
MSYDGLQTETVYISTSEMEQEIITKNITFGKVLNAEVEITVEGEVDNTKSGEYNIKVKAEDKNGNISEKNFKVTVKEIQKIEETQNNEKSENKKESNTTQTTSKKENSSSSITQTTPTTPSTNNPNNSNNQPILTATDTVKELQILRLNMECRLKNILTQFIMYIVMEVKL